jgi:PhnB protein
LGFPVGSRVSSFVYSRKAGAVQPVGNNRSEFINKGGQKMLNPYLFYSGNCEAAFKHYEKVLGGKIEVLLRNEQAPPDMPSPPERKKQIMHGRMSIGGHVLMASDSPPEHFHKPQGFSVSLSVADPAEAERKFKALADGGNITMPFDKTFFAKGFGMCIDQFGIPWMIFSPLEGQ